MKIAHVTLYPPKGKKHSSSINSGVASYSKNLVTHMQDSSAEQVVISNILADSDQAYDEEGVTVRRVFRRSPSFILSVHKQLKKEQPDVVHIQQELALFGGIITAYLLQWLVFLWRDRTVITLHGVVDPLTVDKKFVKENNSRLPVWLVRLAFRIIYTPLIKWPCKIIVHEEHFKNIAVARYGGNPDKITVIPHGVEMLEPIDKITARKALNVRENADVILFMGYATGYKGIDLLIEGFSEYAKRNPKAYLILGAGKHPKLTGDSQYEKEYERLKTKAKQLINPRQYTWEGFIKEPEITTYYSASDLSIYPYTTALSSSGPMSFAIGYQKSFLVSTAFENIFKQYPQLLFERDPHSLADRLTYFFSHRDEYDQVSSELREKRNWNEVGLRTLQAYSDEKDQEGAYETEKSVTAG